MRPLRGRLARLAEGARFTDIGRQAEPRLSLRRLQRVVDPHQRQELPRGGGIERQSVEVRGGLMPIAHLIGSRRVGQQIDWGQRQLAPGCLG